MTERDNNKQSEKEKWGKRFILGGIVAGLVGLLAHMELLVEAGVGLAASGVIFRGVSKKPAQA